MWLMIVLMTAGLLDIPSQVVVAQRVTLGGVLSAATLAMTVVLLAFAGVNGSVLRTLLPYAGFLLWATFSVMWTPLSMSAVQNLILLYLFLLMILLASRLASAGIHELRDAFLGVGLAVWLAVIIASANVALGGEILEPRYAAAMLVIGVAYHCACWQAGRPTHFWLALVVAIIIGLTLSRAALIVALALFPLAYAQPRGLAVNLRPVLMAVVSGAAVWAAVTYIGPLNERFFSGDLSLQIGGMRINVEGRIRFWEVIWRSTMDSPWIGHGVGSASILVNRVFPTIAHPHSEYLRLWHDFGIIGLVAWLFATTKIALALFRNWRTRPQEWPLHGAALLALIGYCTLGATDNVLVYYSAVVPVGVLVGLALGAASRDGGHSHQSQAAPERR